MEQEIIKILESSNGSYIKIENPKSIEIIYNLLKNNIFDDTVTYDDPIIYLYAGYYYKREGKYDLMKKYYDIAIEAGNSTAMNNLGGYYQEQQEYDLMKKYVEMSINSGNSYAMNNLGYYYEGRGEYDLMKKYYMMAIELENLNAMYHLGRYYYTEKKLGIAIKYLSMASNKGEKNAINLLKIINNKFDP